MDIAHQIDHLIDEFQGYLLCVSSMNKEYSQFNILEMGRAGSEGKVHECSKPTSSNYANTYIYD